MKPLVSAGVLGLLPIPLVPEIRTDAAGDQPTTLDDHSGPCPCHVFPSPKEWRPRRSSRVSAGNSRLAGRGAEASDPGRGSRAITSLSCQKLTLADLTGCGPECCVRDAILKIVP